MSDDEIEEEEEVFSDVSDEELSDDELAELAEIESAAKTKMAAIDPVLKTSNKIQTIRIVKDDDRVTSNRLTKYEVSRILSIRAQQISDTPIIYAKLSGERDPVKIAYLELSQKKCPLLLRRVINDNNSVLTVEQWNPNEMTIPLINIEV
jgi:DNA-directed RNA polymerase I, II, and III subunit RPABC2